MPYNAGKGIQQGAANFYRHKVQEDIAELDFFDVWFTFNGLDDGAYYYGTNSVKAFVEEVRFSWLSRSIFRSVLSRRERWLQGI